MDANSDLFDVTLRTVSGSLENQVKQRDWLQSWRERMATLQTDRSEWKTQISDVMTSDELTPKGRQRRISELHARMAERLKAEEAALRGYETHLSQLKQTAKPKERATEMGEVLRYLQLQEIRQELKGMDPLMLRGEYESRVADPTGAHDLWLEAVETAPGTPLLPGEVLDRGKAARALRALPPETRQQISDLTAIADAHRHFVGLIERELPQPDPIAQQAAGSGDA